MFPCLQIPTDSYLPQTSHSYPVESWKVCSGKFCTHSNLKGRFVVCLDIIRWKTAKLFPSFPAPFLVETFIYWFFLRGLYTVNHTKHPPRIWCWKALTTSKNPTRSLPEYPDPGDFIELLYHRRAGVSDTKGAGSLPVFIAGWFER